MSCLAKSKLKFKFPVLAPLSTQCHVPEVEEHGVERGAALVLGDGDDGCDVADKRQDGHGGEDGALNRRLQ